MQQCLQLGETLGKTKKNSKAQIRAKRAKIRPKTTFFCHFFKFGSLVFLKITWDGSLEQCLTSRGKTKEKKSLEVGVIGVVGGG